ncbi:MAG: homocysteine S-methyltransferase family protein [Defluviitaleaceae bacterium]|nr:homocysteine S-methyltransferase family protein [Defluviitaleaceae bacterium]
MDLFDKLGKELIFFDGAMGSILQSHGLDTLPEIWNITKPHIIEDIQKGYADAGCDIITANTLGANRLKLADSGYEVNEIIEAAVKISKSAANGRAKVALDIGPTGKLLAPFGDLSFESAVEIFGEMARAAEEAGADLILIETMNDTYEIKAAMIGAKEYSNLPIMVSFTPDATGRLLTGADILTAVTMIESLGACALGLNCGTGPIQMKELAAEVLASTNLPVMISPNGGLPKITGKNTVYDMSCEEFAEHMVEIAAQGVSIIGGCCGTEPKHIAAMIAACNKMDKMSIKISKEMVTRISSYGQTVILGDSLAIIGERINPTGKPRLKQALKDNDMEYVLREGLAQIDEGALLLDVNAGMPGIDEAKTLAEAVFGLQSITAVPLVIDTANITAAEAALRLYNGKPLLNSVNGKKESLEQILPLAKKYGAALVALLLDDGGIPETTGGRVAIAEKIVKEAAHYGIPKEDIVVDALTLTISTNDNNAKITLDTVDYLKNQMGLSTILGVSNISFGLPSREILNAGFLLLAASRGLSAAIVNTANKSMMDAVHIHNLLTGQDENSSNYIKVFSPKAPDDVKKDTSTSLFNAILSGLGEDARLITQSMLKDTDSLDIINEHLIPSLDKAGQDFEKGVIFLPQLLMSASAAKSAFEAIRLHMSKKGQTTAKRGTIVLATVKGDIHDIGKNIVKTLLENYNFHIIDLGKNVEPDLVLETVIKEKVNLVGLSALMTTTVAYMEETIARIKEKAPHCQIMVGGAVLTESYANEIGADFYSPDAMGAVKYAVKVLDQHKAKMPID